MSTAIFKNINLVDTLPELRLTATGSDYMRQYRSATTNYGYQYNRTATGITGTMVETTIWSSKDGVLADEKGIQTFGDTAGRTVLDGLTTRFNVAGVEKGQLSTTMAWTLPNTITGSSDAVQFKILGNSTQTSNLMDVFASNGTTARFHIKGDGNVGIGTTAPSFPLQLVTAASVMNFVGSDNLTNANQKNFRIGVAHYTNAEEPLMYMMGSSASTTGLVYFGGGSSYANAATQLSFYTAANNTTTTGTERMRIDSVGRIGINTAANAAALLEIKNTTTTYANLQITSDGTYPSFINSSASNTAFHGTYFNSYRSRGTQASKTTTATDDTIFAYEMFGYDGNSNVKGAQFKCLVDNTVSDEVVPMRFIWGTMNSAGTLAERMRLTAEGYLGIGTTAPSAKLHSLSTTEQLRLGYDASNYLSATIGSTGNATLALTGTTPIFTFSQAIKGAGGFQSSDGTAGLTATKVFNDGAVVNTVTIKDGLITAWTQI